MQIRKAARKVARKFSYSNLIATMALFIALGGISWAAATAPKNSVAAKSIKKNAVTTAKIKNNAVTGRKIKSSSILGSDLKNDSVTGSDVNESSLGTVPSATSAGTANDSFNMVKTVQSSNTAADEASGRAAATEVPIISSGAVSVYAKCFVVTGAPSATHFELIARTSANGAALEGYSTSDGAFEPALTTSTPEDERQITDDETDSADDVDDDDASGASLLGPDSKGLTLSAVNYARTGNPTNPPSLLPASDSCSFHVWGSLVK